MAQPQSIAQFVPSRPASVREYVRDAQAELRQRPDMAATRASELLAQLSSLYGNCLAEYTEAECAYNEVYLQHFQAEGKANRANIRAKATEEYKRMREAKDTRDLTAQLVMSLKKIVTYATEEAKFTPR